LPGWLHAAGVSVPAVEIKRLILIACCGLAALGGAAILRLRIPRGEAAKQEMAPARMNWLRQFRPSRFLWRFLVCMSLWSGLLAAFTPFATVYLSRELHMPFERIGVVFSIAQVVQFGAGLLIPVLVRALGMMNGIAATQVATALTLGLLAAARNEPQAVFLYLALSATQWMSSPSLYNLLMDETPEGERSTAAAMTMFSNSLASSGATAAAGILFTRFGYPPVLAGFSAAAAAVAILCRVLLARRSRA
jgi:MFS family permease